MILPLLTAFEKIQKTTGGKNFALLKFKLLTSERAKFFGEVFGGGGNKKITIYPLEGCKEN